MKKLILALLLSPFLWAQTTISWQQLTSTGNPDTWPRWVAQAYPKYDPTAGRALVYMTYPGAATTIYATDLYSWNPANNAFSLIGGLASQGKAVGYLCQADYGAEWPGERHPDGQWVVDTTRNAVWYWGALNQACHRNADTTAGDQTVTLSGDIYTGTGPSGLAGANINIAGVDYTIASVTNSRELELTTPAAESLTGALAFIDYESSYGRRAMWRQNLATNTWTLIGYSGIPSGSPVFTYPANYHYNNGSAVYSPPDDLVVVYRSNGDTSAIFTFDPDTYAWDEPVLSAGTVNTQNTGTGGCAGNCVTRQAGTSFVTDGSWDGKFIILHNGGTRVKYAIASVQSGDVLTLVEAPGSKTGWDYGLRPTARTFTAMVYDASRQKVFLYGGQANPGATWTNELWSYDVPAHRFDLLCKSGCTPPPTYAAGQYGYPAFGRISTGKYLLHDDTSASSPGTYLYDPDTDQWSTLQTGSGPANVTIEGSAVMAGDKMLWIGHDPGGYSEVWVGNVSGTPAASHRMRGGARLTGAGTVR